MPLLAMGGNVFVRAWMELCPDAPLATYGNATSLMHLNLFYSVDEITNAGHFDLMRPLPYTSAERQTAEQLPKPITFPVSAYWFRQITWTKRVEISCLPARRLFEFRFVFLSGSTNIQAVQIVAG